MNVRVGMGLGLERIGLLALSRPKAAALLVLGLTALLVSFLPSLRFQADILGQADQGSEIWQDYEELQADFALALPHIYLLVDAPDDLTRIAPWLESQNRLVLDLRLTPGISDVQSVFALRRASPDGGTAPLLDPAQFPSDPGEVRELSAARPDVAGFLSPDGPVSRIAIVLDQGRIGQAGFADDMVARVADIAAASDLDIRLAGPSVVEREISETLLRDMLRMIALSTLVGWSVGFVIFSDFRTVLVVNIISPIAMLWTAGFAAMTGQALHAITVVLPLLASVIAFADAIHVVVPLSKRLRDGAPAATAIAAILRRVGPATALTSMTTALAFGSLALAGGGMVEVAWLGVSAVVLAWLAVILLGPLLCLALAREGFGATRLDSARLERRFRALAERCLALRNAIAAGAVVATAALLLLAHQLPSDHVPAAYLPNTSEVRAAETAMERHFSGSLSLLVSMPLAVPDTAQHPDNLARLASWQAALDDVSDSDFVWSRARLDAALVAQMPDDAPDLSETGDRLLLVVNHGWERPGSWVLARLAELQAVLAPLPGGGGAQVSGASAVVAATALGDVERLRTGVFLSVAFAAGLVAILSRSLAAGIGVGLSVLLSILVVLVGSGLGSGAVSYGLIVALIISVGIAIDDGIHLVNAARTTSPEGPLPPAAWADGIAHTGSAILFTSVILVVTLTVTQVSAMPALRAIGREIALALAAALVFTLTIIAPTAALADRGLTRLFTRKVARDG